MNTDEFENAMNEGRIERKHCKWMLAEVKRLQKVINKAMQQHTVLKMREQLFESCCIDAEGQYESGHWEREEK